MLDAPLTPEEQTDPASVPVFSGVNGPRPKLVNASREMLNLSNYYFTGLAINKTIKSRVMETSANLVWVAVDLQDSTALLVRPLTPNPS